MKLWDMTESGNCYKVRLVLHQLGLDYERIEVGFGSSAPRDPALAALNPANRVPLLVLDDGRALAESNAIVCYLAEGTALMPDETHARALVLRWMFFEQNHVEPNIAVVRHWTMAGHDDEEHRAAMRIRTAAGHEALGVMERHLDGREFFEGGYSAADVALYAYTHVAPEGGFSLEPYPRVRAWIDRVAARPGHIPMR